jgi:hypothetical protein
MMQTIILHSIGDAEHCLKNKLFEKGLLFSTHSSVDVYLREKYGIRCECLSRFLNIKEIDEIKEKSSRRVHEILEALDGRIAPLINSKLDLKMNFFTPLYSYLGKYHYFNYAVFTKCMEEAIKEYKISCASFYNLTLNDHLDIKTSIRALFQLFSPPLKTELIVRPLRQTANEYIKRAWTLSKLVMFSPIIPIKRVQARLRNYKRLKPDDGKKYIFLQEPLYDLEFLKRNSRKFNFIINRNNNKIDSVKRFGGDDNLKINIDPCYFKLEPGITESFDKVFLNDIREDFLGNLDSYVYYIKGLESLARQAPLSLGIWGLPPIGKLTALIFEFIKSKGIKIIGSQHGCTYGESYVPWHFNSDFNRCDYFISYGFTEQDLKRLHPDKHIETQIVPCGSAVDMQNSTLKKKIDILFPITNAMSIFEGGMARIPPDRLVARQIALLEYLNTLEHLTVYIKPFRFSNYKNCSVIPVLKRLKNLKVVDYLKLEEFLTKYQPRAVLIEYPSQPLFETLHLDAEIFLMDNPLRPYGRRALEELTRRVYYAEDVKTMISMLDLFVKGNLPQKRDNTFFNHYVYNKNREETILQLIDTLYRSA